MRVYKVSKKFGARVQKIRKDKIGISQEEMAGRLGIHRNHLGRIERGESNPPLPLMEKIARILKIHLSDLF